MVAMNMIFNNYLMFYFQYPKEAQNFYISL